MKRLELGAGFLAIGFAAMFGVGLWIFASLSPHREPSPAVHVLALSSNGEWMASGTALGNVRLWKADSGAVVREITAGEGALNDLQFSNAGDVLAIANKNITLVKVDDSAQAQQIRKDSLNYGTVRFSPDNLTLLSINGKNEIVVIDVSTNAARPIYCCTSIYGEVAFSPDGSRIVWAGHWPGALDFHTGAVVGRFAKDRELMTLGPIATDHQGAIYMGSQDGRVYRWDVETKARLGQSPAQKGYVRSIAVVGDTGWIAYAPEMGAVRIWNPATGSSRIVDGANTTSNLAYDAVHNRTAFGTSTGEIQYWDLVGGRLLKTIVIAVRTLQNLDPQQWRERQRLPHVDDRTCKIFCANP